jgi:hypothetical protein
MPPKPYQKNSQLLVLLIIFRFSILKINIPKSRFDYINWFQLHQSSFSSINLVSVTQIQFRLH